MTKAEFVSFLESQFKAIVSSVTRNTISDIQGHSARMDGQTFADWLRSEMDKANAEPALKVFDRVYRPSHSTPHEAADSLADLLETEICTFVNNAGKIAFDPTRVNWQEQWDSAAPLLSNFHPEKSEGWQYRRAFADYMAAVKAEARAGVFAAHIGQAWPQGSVLYQIGKGEAEALDFRADVMKGGNAYFLLWEECKETLKDNDLPEKSFLLSDIEHCEEEIERWKTRTHSFRNSWVGMLKANIRAHRERLEELEKETADKGKPNKQTPKAEPPAFADLFVNAEAMERALQAARGIDPPMIYANDQWTGNYNQNPGLRAFFEFCNDKDYLKKPTNKTSAIQAFAFHFTGKEAGKNAPSAMPDGKLKGKLINFVC